MKNKLTLLSLALVFASGLARADFTPISLAPGSFNADVVLEKTAPPPINIGVTATMDGGTNITGNTWYEIGYNTNTTGTPPQNTTGLPVHGSTVNYADVLLGRNYSFLMPPDYTTNNVVLVGHNNGGGSVVVQSGALNLTTPAAYSWISIMNSAGNGPVNNVQFTINFSDGTSETSVFSSPNWFDVDGSVYTNLARISINGGGFDVRAAGTRSVLLFKNDYSLSNPAGIITNVVFSYAGGVNAATANGRAMIFGISGSADGINFTPINVSGWGYDGVLEAGAPPNVPFPTATPTTATMDNGAATNAAGQLSGNTFFEQGYYSRFPTSSGLPQAGSTITSATLPSAHYMMPADYTANNAVMLDRSNATANITLATPATYGALSFLCSGANTPTPLLAVVQFQDGTTQTNALAALDWFNNGARYAFTSFGRINFGNRSINTSPEQLTTPFNIDPRTFVFGNANNGNANGLINPNPKLFDVVINMSNTVSAVTNILLVRTNGAGATPRSIIFAVSGAPVDSVPPALASQPGGGNGIAPAVVKNWAGSNIVISVTASAGTGPLSYQWQKAPKGGGVRNIFDPATFANVTDGGNITGSGSASLTIGNATLANSGDYWVIVSNAFGVQTSAVATVTVLSTNQVIPVPGDPIVVFGGATPAAESVDHAIDRVAQKWLSFSVNNNTLPFLGPVGFTVTPAGLGSIITSMRFYTANDTAGRDPSDYTLEGSNDGGANWSPIAGGLLKGTLAIPTGRNGTGSATLSPLTNFVQEVDFANNTGYKSYRVTFTNIYTPETVALMQIGEVELIGTLLPNPPIWTRQPEPTATVFAGASPTFTVAAVGFPLPGYQWYKNGATLIPGATSSSYTFPNALLADSGATFSCIASNQFGTTNSTSATLTVIAVPTQSYPAAVLADNVLGFWRLNEGPDDGAGNSGVVAKDYRGGRNGSYNKTVLQADGYNPSYDSDKAATFGSLDTLNCYVGDIKDVDFGRAINTAGAAFSVEAWVNGADQAGDAGIVSKGYNGILNAGTGTGTEQFVLDVSGGAPRKFRFLVRDAAGNGHVAQSLISPNGDWRHLVGVCDQPNGKVYLYVDGLLAATGDLAANAGVLAQPLPMTIGARKSGGITEYDNQWVGRIDDVAVYGSALNPGQVLGHFYAAQRPPIITLQPVSVTAAENVSVSFTTAAYGPPTQTYQWYLSDGSNPTAPVAGQTSSNLTFTTTSAQNGNNYQLVVSNSYAASTSSVAQLTVVSGPPSFFVNLPSADTFFLGHVIQLRVDVGGTAPFTYQWQKDGVNISDNYRISGSQTNVLVIGYATNSDSGSYQVLVGNGTTTPSIVDVITVTTATPPPPFSAATTGWTLSGTTAPIMAANRLELTSGLGNTARAAFLNEKQSIASFNAAFVYQAVSGAGGADGVAFCIQNDARGTTAVGGAGGGLAYGGITPSAALALNIYDPNTRGIRFLQNGALPAAGAGAFAPITPVLVGGNANPIQVTVGYSGGIVTASFRDLVTAATFTTNFTADIPAIVGSSSAYVGFTGADGGVASTQVISNFTMLPLPVLLKSQKVGGSLVLSWPSSTGAFLKSTPTLASPVWTGVTSQFRVVGNEAQVTVAPLIGDQFYRLEVYP